MSQNNNAWLVRLDEEDRNSRFSVAVYYRFSLLRGVEEGGGVLITGADPL